MWKRIIGADIKRGKYIVDSHQAIEAGSLIAILDVECEKCNSLYHPSANLIFHKPNAIQYCDECRNNDNRMHNMASINATTTSTERTKRALKSWSGDKGKKRSTEYSAKWHKTFNKKSDEKKAEWYKSCRDRLPILVGEDHPRWNPNKKDYSMYLGLVHSETRIHRHVYETWDNYNLRGMSGVEGAYQLDHIIPIKYGFDNNICPSVIGGINNLQLLPWKENISKGCKYTNK